MEIVNHENGGGLITFKAFGVSMWLATNRREARERIHEVLPPGWEPVEEGEIEHRLGILGDDQGTYGVDLGGAYLLEGVPLDLALETMDSVVRMRIAQDAPDTIFVHAGVVGYGEKALLIPGGSFTGKTSLVAALVRAGATYYSDECAPLDADGRVHPYAKPLSIRGENQLQTDHHVESIGGVAGDEPLPVGAIVFATYRSGTEWEPDRLSAGEGSLELLSNTIPARERPAESLRAIKRAVEGAVLLKGDRGEADELAPRLLAELEASRTA